MYNIFLFVYSIGVRMASLGNPKAKKWVNGRKNIYTEINSKLKIQNPDDAKTGSKLIWMHCASLGEFEQGRPLLEALRINASTGKADPLRIVLTFFSPSGFEVMKDYKGADYIFYLPMDSRANAKRFIDAINPSLVLWVKYEYWYYYLNALKQRNITAILVSGIFRENQPFFRWYGGIWKKMLSSFTHFFVQNQESKELLATINFTENVTVNGDTRFDRVLEIANTFQPVPFISEFCGNHIVIVAGSTWEEDEIELLHFVKSHPEIKFIIAPHEIESENLNDVKQKFKNSIFYSDWVAEGKYNNDQPAGSAERQSQRALHSVNVLIIDNIGMLSRLYKYATLNYVGGGFGDDGVHNVLEAAVYGKPVIFGPVFEKFDDAIGLVDEEGGISVGGPIKLEEVLNTLLKDETERKRRGEAAKNYVLANAGASKKIIRFIQEKRLLTS